jgi:hypothetical protein
VVRWFIPGPQAVREWQWEGCIAVEDADPTKHSYLHDSRLSDGDPFPVADLASPRPSLIFNRWPARGEGYPSVRGLAAEIAVGISVEVFEFDADIRVDEGL